MRSDLSGAELEASPPFSERERERERERDIDCCLEQRTNRRSELLLIGKRKRGLVLLALQITSSYPFIIINSKDLRKKEEERDGL
jgi:hypothetical protein